jgi:uncharacterized protein
MKQVLLGKPVIPGSANGPAMVSAQPLSFWGGYDPATGEIIDRRHDCSGQIASGRVLVFPGGKGSSTSSAILLEAIRRGTAPAAILTLATDPILALGAIVADELYNQSVPMVVLSPTDFGLIRNGERLAVEPDGTVRRLPGIDTET